MLNLFKKKTSEKTEKIVQTIYQVVAFRQGNPIYPHPFYYGDNLEKAYETIGLIALGTGQYAGYINPEIYYRIEDGEWKMMDY